MLLAGGDIGRPAGNAAAAAPHHSSEPAVAAQLPWKG